MSIIWTLWSIFVIFIWCFGGKLATEDSHKKDASKIWTAVGLLIIVSVIVPSIMFLMVI